MPMLQMRNWGAQQNGVTLPSFGPKSSTSESNLSIFTFELSFLLLHKDHLLDQMTLEAPSNLMTLW